MHPGEVTCWRKVEASLLVRWAGLRAAPFDQTFAKRCRSQVATHCWAHPRLATCLVDLQSRVQHLPFHRLENFGAQDDWTTWLKMRDMEMRELCTLKGGLVGEFPPIRTRKQGKIGLIGQRLLVENGISQLRARGERRLITCGYTGSGC